jgi:hypothetical protein
MGMARTRVLVATVVTLVAVAGVAVLGWVVGSAIAHRRADTEQEAKREGLTGYLEENIQGIGVGQPFPDIPIWSCGESESHTVRELLPGGGVIVLVGADCASCAETAAVFDAVVRTLGGAARPAILLLDHAKAPEAFTEALAARGVKIPLYCDVTESMRREHTVATTRAYFRLDSDGIVQEFGPVVASTPEVLSHILTE